MSRTDSFRSDLFWLELFRLFAPVAFLFGFVRLVAIRPAKQVALYHGPVILSKNLRSAQLLIPRGSDRRWFRYRNIVLPAVWRSVQADTAVPLPPSGYMVPHRIRPTWRVLLLACFTSLGSLEAQGAAGIRPHIVLIYAGLGEKTKAADYLQREYLNELTNGPADMPPNVMLDGLRNNLGFAGSAKRAQYNRLD